MYLDLNDIQTVQQVDLFQRVIKRTIADPNNRLLLENSFNSTRPPRTIYLAEHKS
jgi:hypothetical protein